MGGIADDAKRITWHSPRVGSDDWNRVNSIACERTTVTLQPLLPQAFLFSLYIVYDTQLVSGKFGHEYSIDDYIIAAANM